MLVSRHASGVKVIGPCRAGQPGSNPPHTHPARASDATDGRGRGVQTPGISPLTISQVIPEGYKLTLSKCSGG